ncbi:MAG: class I adenylate-forming enzyme family protein [Terriglobia bacterium]
MPERLQSELPDRDAEQISDLVAPWAERTPGHPALRDPTGQWTYRQLADAILEARDWLEQSDVRPGDRVMMVCENCRAFVALLLAAGSIGAWPVPVNARLSAREVDEIREHCGARCVIYVPGASLFPARHAERHGVTISSVGILGDVGLGLFNHEAVPEPVEQKRMERVAVVLYTSGSTGRPKGVMLTQRNLLFAASGSAKIRALSPRDRITGILPIAHVAGLSVALLGTLISGATLYLFERFDPASMLRSLECDALTVLLGTPAMYSLLAEYASLKGIRSLNLPRLRVTSTAGAPLGPEVKSSAEKLFGLPLQNAYGMTECSPNIAQTRIEAPRSDTSVGPAFPGVEIRLLGDDREPVGEGEVGELWVRGPNIMKGYYREPEATASVLDHDGWFRTGDLARMEDGNLFIAGRAREMIIHFGFNVYPAEVEAVLDTHPAVARSAVIGRRSGEMHGDEEILAFVQPVSGLSPTPGELAEHAARALTPYKRPSRILVVPALPVTANGKVAKNELARIASRSFAENSA